VREIGAAEMAAPRLRLRRGGDALQIAGARVAAAPCDAFGDLADPRLNGHGNLRGLHYIAPSSYQVRPSRSMSAIDAEGPQVPAV